MSNKIRDGQRAVQAVQNKIQNKFFKEKTSISMFESEKSKDAKAKAAKNAAKGIGKYTPGPGVTKDFKLDPNFKLPKV